MIKEEIYFNEKAHVDLVKDVFCEKSDEFNELNITYGDIKIRQDYSEDNEYWSELEVDLFIDNKLIDVIEFFIYRNNKLETQIAETKIWLLNTVNEIMSRFKM